ncbi:MAG: hypothetical protein LLG97_03445 [Deltaproteobacteria bacterium]|nr:hypothetical protein [Deltaproteobacteria bacterium]
MAENYRIKFNPATKEIEVEGSETFVKAYFAKLQAMMSGIPEEKTAGKEAPKTAPTKKEPGEKRVTNIDKVVELVQGSTEGISTIDLQEKTGLVERQIWGIVTRAAKLGKIKKVKRGVYIGA